MANQGFTFMTRTFLLKVSQGPKSDLKLFCRTWTHLNECRLHLCNAIK